MREKEVLLSLVAEFFNHGDQFFKNVENNPISRGVFQGYCLGMYHTLKTFGFGSFKFSYTLKEFADEDEIPSSHPIIRLFKQHDYSVVAPWIQELGDKNN